MKVNTQNIDAHFESRQCESRRQPTLRNCNGKEPLLVVGGCSLTRSQPFVLGSPSRFVQCYMLALCIELEISAG